MVAFWDINQFTRPYAWPVFSETINDLRHTEFDRDIQLTFFNSYTLFFVQSNNMTTYYSSGGGQIVILQKLKMKEGERCWENTLPLLSSAGVVFIF